LAGFTCILTNLPQATALGCAREVTAT
jgi:hypothetical protein